MLSIVASCQKLCIAILFLFHPLFFGSTFKRSQWYSWGCCVTFYTNTMSWEINLMRQWELEWNFPAREVVEHTIFTTYPSSSSTFSQKVNKSNHEISYKVYVRRDNRGPILQRAHFNVAFLKSWNSLGEKCRMGEYTKIRDTFPCNHY